MSNSLTFLVKRKILNLEQLMNQQILTYPMIIGIEADNPNGFWYKEGSGEDPYN